MLQPGFIKEKTGIRFIFVQKGLNNCTGLLTSYAANNACYNGYYLPPPVISLNKPCYLSAF